MSKIEFEADQFERLMDVLKGIKLSLEKETAAIEQMVETLNEFLDDDEEEG